MDLLANRKRPADSDNEEDVANKKQVVDAVDSNDYSATDANDQDQDQDQEQEFTDALSTNEQINDGQTAATSTDTENEDGADDTLSDTHIPYQCLVMLNVEVTCDENPSNPAAVQVTKVTR